MTWCLLLLLASSAAATSDEEYQAAFKDLQASMRGGKAFGGRTASASRYALFKTRYDEITAINGQERSWTAAPSDLSLLTNQERSNMLLGLNITNKPSTKARRVRQPNVENLPDAVDWFSAGKVTEVKSQGSCGACWAFAAVATVESRYAILTGTLKTMSEQQLLDCTYLDQGINTGCQGGWMSTGFSAIRYTLGNRLALAGTYPYTQEAGDTCNPDASFAGSTENALVEANIASSIYTSVPYEIKEETAPYERYLAGALTLGPLTVAIEVVNSMYSYSRGIYDETDCMGAVNHAVTVVAYDQESFTIKNSWGSVWGNGGYIKFSRAIKNQCLIGLYPEHPNMVVTGATEEEEEDTDACDPNPCQNKGKCKKDASAPDGFYCKCKKEFAGSTCQEKKIVCKDKASNCPTSRNHESCLAKKRFVKRKCQLSCGYCYL